MVTTIQFRVLGPLEARACDGRLVKLGAAKQRSLLAALLLHPNRFVSLDRLIDALWTGQPPRAAVGATRTYVSALRQSLGLTGSVCGCRLVAEAGGYRLVLAPGDLDSLMFEELASKGQRALAGGDPALAADQLQRALDLWRGRPLEDVTAGAWLDVEAARLAERRLAVQEAYIEARLALGQHTALLAEVRPLVVDHPLSERLWAHWMLALYRSGRRAEALGAFRQLRRRLVDDLGVEPGQPLQRLHQQILAADPGLDLADTEAGVESRDPSRPPAQLPPDVPAFSGRTAHLRHLDALLDDACTDRSTAVLITAVAGTAGVGKTALAVHWAHRVAERFGDGQLYVNLRGFDPTGTPMTPAEAIRGFLDALAVPLKRIPTSLPAQAALYRSLLAGRRVLVVLDNARDAEQVRPLLPGSPGCLVVVTSRNQLPSLVATEGAQPLVLDLLTVPEARQMLTRRLGAERVAAEPEATDDIISSCARLPLALAIVAARAATHRRFPLAALAEELRDPDRGLDAFAGGETAADVRAVFSWSYRTLSAPAARLFRLLGLLPGPDIATPAAASLAGSSVRGVRARLAELAQAHLVIEHTPGRFGFHDLLRAYATELAHIHDGEAERRVALHRVLDHLLHTAHAANLLLNPHRDQITLAAPQPRVTAEGFAERAQAMAWFTAEHAVLLTTVDRAADAGFDTHAWHLAWALHEFFERRGHWHDWAVTQLAALHATQRLADRPGQAHAHCDLAAAYNRVGRYDDAHRHLRQALDLYGELGDLTGQATTHYNLAWVFFDRRNHHREALSHAERALHLYRVTGHLAGQAKALNGVGWYRAQLGDHKRALASCRHAVALHRQLGDHLGEAASSDTLGYVHHQLGQYQHAIACYRNALDLYRAVGERYGEGETLAHLGDTHDVAGESDSARSRWQQALTIFDELDHPDAEKIRARLHRLAEPDVASVGAMASAPHRAASDQPGRGHPPAAIGPESGSSPIR